MENTSAARPASSTLYIRGVPGDVRDALATYAKRTHRTLSGAALALIEEALKADAEEQFQVHSPIAA